MRPWRGWCAFGAACLIALHSSLAQGSNRFLAGFMHEGTGNLTAAQLCNK